MKLFLTNIPSHRGRRHEILVEGSIQEVADYINAVGDGYAVGGPLTLADLEENGGNWGMLPVGWSEAAPFYYDTPTKRVGGFASLAAAVRALVTVCESYYLEA